MQFLFNPNKVVTLSITVHYYIFYNLDYLGFSLVGVDKKKKTQQNKKKADRQKTNKR